MGADLAKLKNLILHIGANPHVQNLGETKLWKLIYFIDAVALAKWVAPSRVRISSDTIMDRCLVAERNPSSNLTGTVPSRLFRSSFPLTESTGSLLPPPSRKGIFFGRVGIDRADLPRSRKQDRRVFIRTQPPRTCVALRRASRQALTVIDALRGRRRLRGFVIRCGCPLPLRPFGPPKRQEIEAQHSGLLQNPEASARTEPRSRRGDSRMARTPQDAPHGSRIERRKAWRTPPHLPSRHD